MSLYPTTCLKLHRLVDDYNATVRGTELEIPPSLRLILLSCEKGISFVLQDHTSGEDVDKWHVHLHPSEAIQRLTAALEKMSALSQ